MPALTRFVMRLGADAHTAADAAQAAFADAYPQWDHIRVPKAWLRKVATRAFLRQQLSPETSAPELPDRPALFDDPIELKEQAATVYGALAQLPPRPRQVLTWTLDGYTSAEIAEHLQMSAEAVRQNLHRARERLKEVLTQVDPEKEG